MNGGKKKKKLGPHIIEVAKVTEKWAWFQVAEKIPCIWKQCILLAKITQHIYFCWQQIPIPTLFIYSW